MEHGELRQGIAVINTISQSVTADYESPITTKSMRLSLYIWQAHMLTRLISHVFGPCQAQAALI